SSSRAIVAALVVSGSWALAVPVLGREAHETQLILSASYLAWLWVLYRLFANDERHTSVRPIRPVVLALGFVELLQFTLIVLGGHIAPTFPAAETLAEVGTMFRLLFCVGALVLVHNLFAGASPAARLQLRWPAAALAAMWLYDLNFYTVAHLSKSAPGTLEALRGGSPLVMAALLALGMMRGGDELRLRPSRSFAFQSFSLLVIGGYLVAMVAISQWLAYTGGDFGSLVQLAFLVIASAAALVFLPSRRLRGWLRVTLTKHLFQHRYDYRAEWLRFTQTIGRAGSEALDLHERVIEAVADVTDSPAGLLLTPTETGALTLDANWRWPQVAVPGEALPRATAAFIEAEQYILDLDDVRSGRGGRIARETIPQWLFETRDAWALVPLLHYDRLIGVVVLARPPVARTLDWEDFDLLRVIGRQLASYLAEQAGQEALGEAQRFDEFNRRIAFVMHDIKNLASQLSLLARNDEKHADNPAFRADMLVTLRNSADKLNALLARLGRYGGGGADQAAAVDLATIAAAIAARYQSQHPVVVAQCESCFVTAQREGLEQALVHLVQNAVEASPPGQPVFLSTAAGQLHGSIEVIDSGEGMTPEFVRTRLFKPFHSSRAGGFGIGAFEARELIRAMGGRLDVESRPALGTRFTVHLPLSMAADASISPRTEVA
ncbi:MAG TPA: XrtA/PEP-CTERM system histidine kinase PrsK, partial [Croceibacterium sp.]|nr:XrtA/PEP-CTERM system histidine kinase PrsK [Croceibacterium sp.]